jgi:hypothetical protein
MIELFERPRVDVQAAQYHRLLGYPRDHVIAGRAEELAAAAREWYARHGRPWIYAREAQTLATESGAIFIDGEPFTSTRLATTLREAGAHAAVLVAVSAGPELEEESQRLWREEKPDEYFFLEIFGSAVVEHLTTLAGARLCALAEGSQMAVLPHYSPGYPEWNVAEQPRLLGVLQQQADSSANRSISVESLDSGALRPRKSLLAVFGLTRHTAGIRPLREVVPCQTCSFTPCEYRRAPFQVNVKALKRWAKERLTLEIRGDGSVDAAFLYEGTTCTNMGRPLAFDYRVRLGRPEDGYPILDQHCAPAAGDTGHTLMCRYIDARESLMAAIECEKPLAGRPLQEVLSWKRAPCSAGCYCDPEAREHKWGLVLETIQYALDERRR